MHVVTEFPRRIREIRHFEIPMPDGCRLAARMWLPVDAERDPVPAVVEYIPYRKNDLTAARDVVMHPYVAGHGYAAVRVDLRGSGDSEGVLRDEYLQQELDDGYAVVEWLARQTWCDGNVGMIGISWGGFNGLQIAAMRPPALKAIVTCCSTDDRYVTDVHYMGGTLLIDNLSWASIMFAYNTLPPDPRNRPDDWRDLWRGRLHGSGLWIRNWLRHQRRDDYWTHGSICEDYDAVACPVFAVSGWADGYCGSVFRLIERLTVPRKGLVGPWAHTYPHIGRPGPAIGFLQECVRWWDQWLKGRDTGIMDEPMLRLFMQDGAPPQGAYETRAGRWVEEPSWPSPDIGMRRLFLATGGRLSDREPDTAQAPERIRSPLWVGSRGGKWCSYAAPGDQPVDQRADDAGSLVYETPPLDASLEIAGEAALQLAFECDQPVAMVAVRLSAIAPDGAATRVTYGLLNLAHRDSHGAPEPLEPGRRYQVCVPFKPVAQRFEAGSRIRLSISTSYFPVAWPAPRPATLAVHPAGSGLDLPVRPRRAGDPTPKDFAPAEGAAPLETVRLAAPAQGWTATEDFADGSFVVEIQDSPGAFRIVENDLAIRAEGTERYAFSGADHDTVRGETRRTYEMSRGDWTTRSVTETVLRSTSTHFLIEARLEAWEGDTLVHEATWCEAIERDCL